VIIAYLIPEFPGQTHVWMWREIEHLRQWGVQVQIFSTRPPPERDMARHAFAGAARQETAYVGWGRMEMLGACLWALGTRPRALLGCIKLALTLPVEAGPRWRTVLPLVAPACVLARRSLSASVAHLHCHTCAKGAILAMMHKRLTGIPYSMTLNANIEWWGGAMAQKFGEAGFTIAIAHWLLEQVRRDFPQLEPGQALLGRIGVDTRKWRPAQGHGRHGGPVRIVSVGRLTASKGFDILLRALARVAGAGQDVSLRIIGAGPEREALETLTGDLGIGARVAFLGSLAEEQIIAEFRTADLFVLASHAEPLGVVYMEAMSMGVATIGTAAGGVGEIIRDGVNGLLAPPADADGLAARITRLIGDVGLRQRLAEAGRRTIVEQFDSRLGAAVLFERLTGKKPVSA
jgi:glycosyltransferase involved in cell wall biosynthesis